MEINQKNYNEMQDNLSYLGINIEEINDAINAMEDIVGCDTVDYDIDEFSENVKASINEIINAESANMSLGNGSVLDKLTDIIISAYYNETAYVLNEYAQNNGLESVEFQAENKRDYGEYQISAVVDGDIEPITSGKELDEFFESLEAGRDEREWTNYGDIGYLDEGGVQIRATDREDVYEAIIVVPNQENENTVFAGHTTIDISDYKTDDSSVKNAIESFGADYTDEQLAVAVAENEGLIELGATAFNNNSSLAAYSMSYEAYEIDKAELGHMLVELGVDIDKEQLRELEEVSADYTQTFIDMVEVVDFTVHKDEGGYYFVDVQGVNLGDIESDRFEHASEMADRLSVYLNESYFNDLEEAAEADLAVDFSQPDAPNTAEDWVQFMDKHEDFKESYKHEYDVMKMLSSNHIDDINLDDVVTHFAPEEVKQLEAYKAYKEEWIKDHISDTEMTATKVAYENSEEAEYMTFDEYVQENGFANSFDEFLKNASLDKDNKNDYMPYQLLDRLLSDCKYVKDMIQSGDSLEGLENCFYAKNAKDQIDEMRKLYYSLPEKPVWLTEQEINEYEQFFEQCQIREMGANESVTIDDFMDGIDAVVTKDPDYEKGSEEINLVTVDFKADGKSIASTYDIYVWELEDTMDKIRNGATNCLVDESRSLKDVLKDSKADKSKDDPLIKN